MKQLMLDQVEQNPSQVLQLTGHHGSATLAGSGTTPGEMRAMDAKILALGLLVGERPALRRPKTPLQV